MNENRDWDERSAKFYSDIENIARHPRFGLFNHPPSIHVGDDSYDKRTLSGSKKNFLTNPKYKDGVFSQRPYAGDEYQDPHKVRNLDRLFKQGIIEPPFKPNDSSRKTRPPYEYLSDTMRKDRSLRDEDGNVRTGPRNFLTKPSGRGKGNTTYGHLFNRVEYIPDDYDRGRELEMKEWLEHKSKMISSRPFVSNSVSIKTFESDQKVFEWRPQTTVGTQRTHTAGGPLRPFVVSKHYKDRSGSRGVYPFGDEDWTKDLMKTRPSSTNPWKPNFKGTLAKPTPSITERNPATLRDAFRAASTTKL
eukprot:TRINITY_DN22169_c0_g1_i1.p1 TRINITY_DN22169_c0_g1~~TRINITY_DN22169_c0_g1_i1.p1  ORF type:complete len:304 (-),score=53.39 TRINITY_DN22169_c0_g1_i1:96-1007(-)